ncbi:MAG: tetratricopeptide (TPR) repeat protein [Bacteriovoracaceae bacterium]|jgi:tetratricopeptide (TPR) repeat protein
MKRYRIKLANKRVIGPLSIGEIKDLQNSSKINGKEDFQEFPNGDWARLEAFTDLKEILNTAKTSSVDETHILNLKEFNANEIEDEKLNVDEENKDVKNTELLEKHEEFKYDNIDPVEPKSSTETQNGLKESPETHEKSDNDIHKEERSFSLGDSRDVIEPDESTRIRTINKPLSDFEGDKTKVNPDYQKYLKEIEIEKEKIEADKKRKEAGIVIEEVPTDYENEATQMLNLSEVRKDLQHAIEIEKELDEKEDEKLRAERKKQKERKKNKKALDYEEEDDEENGLRKKIIVAVIVFFVIWLGFFDEDKKVKGSLQKIKLEEPYIVFPSRFDVEDKAKASQLYKKGMLEYRKFKYENINKAARYYFSSTENQFENNPAAAKLIFLYSHNLNNSTDRKNDANSIFKLIQIFESEGYKDPNFASAISYFYYSVGKYEAAIKTFDKYITLNQKVATPDLFAVRLLALIKAGELGEAQKTSKKLASIKNKDLFTIQALYTFYKLQAQQEKMNALLKEGLSIYPDNAYLLLEKGVLMVEKENYKEVKKIIYKLNELNVEGSRTYYSKYLILKGMYHAYNKKIKLATREFKKSLKLYPSIELISMLALLSDATDTETNNLILNSRAQKHLYLGKNYLKNGDLNSAFKEGLKASNIASDMIEVRLFMAELQMKRGYIKDAITQLESLYKENASSVDILFSLIDAYTEAYKFRKVEGLLTAAHGIAGEQDYKFFSAKAKYSLFKGDLNSASGWLQRAINADPLNDENVFELAKLYIKYHDYNKGKLTLKKAMALDPANVDYRIYYAKVLYELETSNAAIGYLYDVLKDFPDNPKILSEIGIYFYRSGQLKKYKNIKEKLLGIPERDVSLFKFLIETARLDDDIEKVISYSVDLLELNPGNLAVRMELASILINLQRYKKAKIQIDMINDRLDSYPKLQFLNAKLYYLVDDLEKSKMLVQKEIEENPTVIDGYILLADIYIKEKDLLSARKQYMKAVQLKPNNVDAIMGIAFVALSSDQYDMALDQYQKAIEIDPNRAETYKLLGDAYRKLGQSQYAIKNYKHFLELSPNSKYKNGIQTYIRTMQ